MPYPQPCPKCGFFNCHGGVDCPAGPEPLRAAMALIDHANQFAPDRHVRLTKEGEGGLHLDGVKPRLADMVPADLLLECGRIFAQNNQPRTGYPNGKYPDIDGKPNYQGGIRLTRLIDSMLRHLLALMKHEDVDPDSGFDHAAHILCNLAMFWWMRQNRKDMDDR